MAEFHDLADDSKPMYAAPEVIADKEYGVAADMWSLGVIAYIVYA